VALDRPSLPARSPLACVAPGLLLVLAVAAAATGLAHVIPLVGGPVLGIALGVAVATARRPSEAMRPGIVLGSRQVLQLAVAMLGTELSLHQVLDTGVRSLPVLAGTLAICLLAAWALGRRLGIATNLRTLIGVGTGICGASAIAAVAPVIAAEEVEVAFAISTIFLFNIVAVIVFPLAGHALGLGQRSFGLFAGTAVNDTSSVVAAATAYGASATHTAVVVKLTRTLAIVPITIGLAAHGAPGAARPLRIARVLPGFMVGFLALAAANSAGLIPASSHAGLTEATTLLVTVALSAIGLSIDLAGLRRTGPRPIVLGAALWLVVSVASLSLQALTS
jgi:uncharacterized integral membrane protein (TIGR00698 family)